MTTEETKDSLVGFLVAIFVTKIDDDSLKWVNAVVEAMTNRWDILEKSDEVSKTNQD